MTRLLKKILYGVFYLFVLGLIVWGGYEKSFGPTPSCFDNIQNQNESGVDCDGLCISCEIKKLDFPRVVGDAKMLSSSAGTVLLGQIQNPNSNYGVSKINYRFNVYDKSNNLVRSIQAQTVLYPGERKTIVGKIDGVKEIYPKISLELSDPVWVKSSAMIKPDISVGKIKTDIIENKIIVSGILSNKSPFSVPSIEVVVVLFDRLGLDLFSSFTNLTIGGFEDRAFSIPFPTDSNLAKGIDYKATQVYANPQ
ncbi:MAG: hypothetical protein AAB617_02655 [Patescibacteria group bacterium]